MRSRMSTVLQKNTTAINSAKCCARSLVSIDFSFNVSEIENTGHTQSNSP
ncbi:hypothetical protein BHE74_00057247 [Ensete ventricosum]|nr:hypothetical protein BHE74_00057247 [Ensete ventricosum]